MSTKETTFISCPQCGETTEWSNENQYKPFCSQRCKLVDLNGWFNEENIISEEINKYE